MPKNKGKGGKNRRRGKNENEAVKRELIYKEDGQDISEAEEILSERTEKFQENIILKSYKISMSDKLVNDYENEDIVIYLESRTLARKYAKVERILGNGRLEADCFDGKKRLCHIRGKLRKKVWINQGDIILVGLRDYQDGKADVIMKYNAEEARNLKSFGEIPDTVKIEEDNDIEFDAAAQMDMIGGQVSEEEESDLSAEEEDDDEEEELPNWAERNPVRNTKWDRQRGKKNNNNFIENI